MKIVKNQIFVPTVAEFQDDIQTSLVIQQPLVEAGYDRGLMLVIRGGSKGVTADETVERQYNNLSKIKDYDSPIITMLSNIPLEEIDFLHNTDYAKEHVRRGIDFTKGLPIGTRRILTFHLNSLVPLQEFKDKDETQWKNEFNRIIKPALEEIARHGHNLGVEVKVESVPVPEFGDVPSSDNRTYRGAKWNELRNPFYITASWGFDQLREIGLGICLDLCHNRTLYEIAKRGDQDHSLYPNDRGNLSQESLLTDIIPMEPNDIVHLNDGLNIFSSKDNTVHVEGVALGKGDIKQLRSAIRYFDMMGIPYVLEINETDFKNRPNTKDSIEYILANRKKS